MFFHSISFVFSVQCCKPKNMQIVLCCQAPAFFTDPPSFLLRCRDVENMSTTTTNNTSSAATLPSKPSAVVIRNGKVYARPPPPPLPARLHDSASVSNNNNTMSQLAPSTDVAHPSVVRDNSPDTALYLKYSKSGRPLPPFRKSPYTPPATAVAPQTQAKPQSKAQSLRSHSNGIQPTTFRSQSEQLKKNMHEPDNSLWSYDQSPHQAGGHPGRDVDMNSNGAAQTSVDVMDQQAESSFSGVWGEAMQQHPPAAHASRGSTMTASDGHVVAPPPPATYFTDGQNNDSTLARLRRRQSPGRPVTARLFPYEEPPIMKSKNTYPFPLQEEKTGYADDTDQFYQHKHTSFQPQPQRDEHYKPHQYHNPPPVQPLPKPGPTGLNRSEPRPDDYDGQQQYNYEKINALPKMQPYHTKPNQRHDDDNDYYTKSDVEHEPDARHNYRRPSHHRRTQTPPPTSLRQSRQVQPRRRRIFEREPIDRDPSSYSDDDSYEYDYRPYRSYRTSHRPSRTSRTPLPSSTSSTRVVRPRRDSSHSRQPTTYVYHHERRDRSVSPGEMRHVGDYKKTAFSRDRELPPEIHDQIVSSAIKGGDITFSFERVGVF